MNIFVGNLSYSSTEETLQELFQEFGEIESAKIITDRETGRSRGFGFVEMNDDGQAQAAIAALDGKDLDGRALKVNEARPRRERSDRPPRRDSY
ncbi:RNA-binding protein [bacterium]|nr:RNA-binding protein [bacterium]MBU1024494.1 RNA-binding protein [bacterium]